MWFIIIFGSVPSLRVFSTRASQNPQTSTSVPSDYNRRHSFPNPRRGNETWVPPSDRRKTWAGYMPSGKAESEREILSERPGRQIVVTRETEVKRDNYF